jgi:hypothetical protein
LQHAGTNHAFLTSYKPLRFYYRPVLHLRYLLCDVSLLHAGLRKRALHLRVATLLAKTAGDTRAEIKVKHSGAENAGGKIPPFFNRLEKGIA